MPNANFALGNTYDTIIRPTGFAIAKDCLRRLGFPETAYIDFTGPTQTSLQEDSALSPTDNKNYFGSNTEAVLAIEEEPIRDRIYEASVIRADNLPIFRDSNIHTYIRPIYSPTQVTLNFKLRFIDEVSANRWRDDLIARSHLLRHEQLHKITYHYQIPGVFLVILHEIYKLKESVDQKGGTFGGWLKENLDPRATSVSNLSGKELSLIMPEEQVRVLGWFDFTGFSDKPVFNKDNGTWDVEWGYNYVYDKPIEASLSYPLVIRQQILGSPFRPTAGQYALENEYVVPNNVNRTLGSFFDCRSRPKGILSMRYPDFDDWYPEDGVDGCMVLWVGLVTISPDNRRPLLNLRELGIHELSEACLDFIQSDCEYVTDPYRSLFDIGVYSNNARALPGQVILDQDLNLSARDDISLEPVYHVVISIRKDLSPIKAEDYTRLRHNACRFFAVLKELYPEAFKAGLLPVPNRRCIWTFDEWFYLVELTRPPRQGLNAAWPWPPKPGQIGGTMSPGARRRLMQTLGNYSLILRRT